MARNASHSALDPSFNRGGDLIEIQGNAVDYAIVRSGSSVIISNTHATYTIPLGTAGLTAAFDDGARELFVLSNVAKIGRQNITETPSLITAVPSADDIPTGFDQSATSRVFLEASATASFGGNYLVAGGAGNETVKFLFGSITLDPSFNRGGDTVELLHAPSDYQARRLGSSVILEGDEGSLIIPVGTAGITLDFDGDERTLLFDATAGSVKIGSEIIDAAGITLG